MLVLLTWVVGTVIWKVVLLLLEVNVNVLPARVEYLVLSQVMGNS